jgi:integrase
MAEGIRKLHSKGCPAKQGDRCRCNAGYEAWVWLPREKKKVRKTFAREAEAKSWRSDALALRARGGLRVAKPTTIEQAWETWHAGAKAGTVTNRSGDAYKPSSLRSYDQAMRLRVLPILGRDRVSEIQRPDLQGFVNSLIAKGLNPSTVQVTLLPLRALYRRALSLGEVAVNPCAGLELPAVRGRRERFASPEEAEALIAAVPRREDRVIWATAMYAGLRRGELRGLRREDVDLANGVIRVERGWDVAEGEIALKSDAGRRKVPITGVLRDLLAAEIASSDRGPSERLFGGRRSQAFSAEKLQARADKAWDAAGLTRITLHECRHTFASLMIAAGVASEQGFNPKALSTFMGHATVAITLDRYGHLMPGTEAEAAAQLDSYLAAQTKDAEQVVRGAGAVPTGE